MSPSPDPYWARQLDFLRHPSYTIQEIHHQPHSDSPPVMGCVSLKVIGGPKTYLRIWENGNVEWGWGLHSTTRKVWPDWTEEDIAEQERRYREKGYIS